MKRQFIIQPAPHPSRSLAVDAVLAALPGMVVSISEPTRSLESNAAMWAALGDISAQVDWYGKKLTPEDWKHVFSSSLKRLEVVPNLDGTGFVALGLSTSAMSKREMSDLLELIHAFGADKGVRWTDSKGAA